MSIKVKDNLSIIVLVGVLSLFGIGYMFSIYIFPYIKSFFNIS